jgi:hypothetical protein
MEEDSIMSLKLGTQDIAGISQNKICNAHFLLEAIWSDHIINDISFLRADTFSWQSGDTYTSVYNHLVQDIQGITAETETIGSYTIAFYRATDGHKVALADQEQTVLNIYNETGVAWYYILDTTNTQFKLPRTKFGFEGLRTNVGDYIDESLPNITGYIQDNNQYANATSASGAFVRESISQSSYIGTNAQTGNYTRFNFNASRSSSTYQDGAPVQERGTQMYLYFYVGDYSQTAIEQTAGLNSELFNNKVDLDASNFTTNGKTYLAGLGIPVPVSTAWENLTLPVTNDTITMPEDGLLVFNTNGGTIGGYAGLVCGNNADIQYATQTYHVLRTQILVPKGFVVQVLYVNAGALSAFGYYKLKGNV